MFRMSRSTVAVFQIEFMDTLGFHRNDTWTAHQLNNQLRWYSFTVDHVKFIVSKARSAGPYKVLISTDCLPEPETSNASPIQVMDGCCGWSGGSDAKVVSWHSATCSFLEREHSSNAMVHRQRWHLHVELLNIFEPRALSRLLTP